VNLQYTRGEQTERVIKQTRNIKNKRDKDRLWQAGKHPGNILSKFCESRMGMEKSISQATLL